MVTCTWIWYKFKKHFSIWERVQYTITQEHTNYWNFYIYFHSTF